MQIILNSPNLRHNRNSRLSFKKNTSDKSLSTYKKRDLLFIPHNCKNGLVIYKNSTRKQDHLKSYEEQRLGRRIKAGKTVKEWISGIQAAEILKAVNDDKSDCSDLQKLETVLKESSAEKDSKQLAREYYEGQIVKKLFKKVIPDRADQVFEMIENESSSEKTYEKVKGGIHKDKFLRQPDVAKNEIVKRIIENKLEEDSIFNRRQVLMSLIEVIKNGNKARDQIKQVHTDRKNGKIKTDEYDQVKSGKVPSDWLSKIYLYKQAKRPLIQSNLQLAIDVANNYSGMDPDDLFGYGNEGLCKAAEIFDYEKGKFKTLASTCINNEIKDGFTRKENKIKLPEKMITLVKDVNKIEQDFLKKEEGRNPNFEEYLELTGLDSKKLKLVLALKDMVYKSLSEPLGEDPNSGEFGDILPDTNKLSVQKLVENKLLKEVLREALEKGFTLTEKNVIEVRFNLNDEFDRELTLEEIGKHHYINNKGERIPVTKEQVRKVEKRALLKLQKRFNLKTQNELSASRTS